MSDYTCYTVGLSVLWYSPWTGPLKGETALHHCGLAPRSTLSKWEWNSQGQEMPTHSHQNFHQATMPQWMSNTAIVIYNIHTFIIVLEKGEIYINFWLFRLLVSLYGLRLLPWNLTGKLCTQMNSRMLYVKASSEWKVSLIQWELYTSRKMGQKEMSEIANLSHWSISNITQIF